MTWKLKLQGVLFAIVVLATVALATGAAWTDAFSFDWGW